MQKIYRAGIIPYTVNNGRVRFIFMKPADPKFGGPEFQIAKGRIETGETALEAALREGEEELGLVRGNVSGIEFLGRFLGRTDIFLCHVIDVTRFNAPHFETSETAWLDLPEFEAVGRKIHIDIVREATMRVNRQVTLR